MNSKEISAASNDEASRETLIAIARTLSLKYDSTLAQHARPSRKALPGTFGETSEEVRLNNDNRPESLMTVKKTTDEDGAAATYRITELEGLTPLREHEFTYPPDAEEGDDSPLGVYRGIEQGLPVDRPATPEDAYAVASFHDDMLANQNMTPPDARA